MRVISAVLPFLPGARSDIGSICAARGSRVVIEVPVDTEFVACPNTAEQDAGIEVNDVGLKSEADVVLGPTALELVITGEGEDIVLHGVRFTVMLMKTAVRSAVNDVVLGEDPAATFVKIDTPSPITDSRGIVPKVVADNRARLLAEGIDTRHIAQNRTVPIRTYPDMMDMVEFDDVVAGESRTVAPGPANADPGVVKVVNVVMAKPIARRLSDPNTDRAVEHKPAVLNGAVRDLIASGNQVGVAPDRGFTDLDPSCT